MEKNDTTECEPLFVCVNPLHVSGHDDPPMTTCPCCSYMVEYMVEEYKDLLDLADAHDAKRAAKHTSAMAKTYTTYNRTILVHTLLHSVCHPLTHSCSYSVSLSLFLSLFLHLSLSLCLPSPPPSASLSPTIAGIHTAAADKSERTSLPDAVGRGDQLAVAVPSRNVPCPCSV